MREELQEKSVAGSSSIIEKQKEKVKQHEEHFRLYTKVVFTACTLFGSIIAIYIGGWVMFAKSILGTYSAYTTGTLTFAYLVKAAIKCIMASTAAGAIWCGGYILGRKLER